MSGEERLPVSTGAEDPPVLYMHAGSGNHGCEAIVRGFLSSFPGVPQQRVRLITASAAEDMRYGLPEAGCTPEEERRIDRHFFSHAAYYAWRAVTGDRESFLRYRFPMLQGKNRPAVAVSIGGDNYCYPDMVPDLILSDRMLQRRGTKTVLLGCSVEPSMLEADPALREDMKSHALILARESLTRDALLAAGVEEAKLMLLPDPAFSMEAVRLPLPDGFAEGGTVGINVSPLIEQYREESGETVLDAFSALIGHILEHTDLQIALIPHVVWGSSDDRRPLGKLYERYRDTKRLVVIGDHGAPELKGFIARCRFFVGARTHATIAAYSSSVPTLVAGYSVKSEGIAKDLFGTAEGHVLSVKNLRAAGLIEAFDALCGRERELRGILAAKMPAVSEKAKQNAVCTARIWREVIGA
ncbi:MAG: polysaccharide pyruvyl transferase family protein [Lachnospiraceae bacterium]|nr:polysaccharide pyruvyl transferase family protein [Lachnospiraceae bacterium]